jgi:hypothetical protein
MLGKLRRETRTPSPGWIVALTLCAFGPYLSTSVGVRTEQPAFFIAAAVLLPIFVTASLPSRVATASGLLAGVLVIGAVGAAYPVNLASVGLGAGSLVAGIVNNLMPIAGIIVATAWLSVGYSRETIFATVGKVVVWVMSINGLVAIAQTKANLTGILHHFWQAAASVDITSSVALRSLSNGRETGIFDQPAQAGFMYGVALLMAVYLWSGRQEGRNRRSVIAPLLIIVGGFLTVSKIFIFVALPIFLLLMLRRTSGRNRYLVRLAAWVFVAVAAFKLSGSTYTFPGAHQLSAYFSRPRAGYVSLFSSGRLGATGSLGQLLDSITALSPITGFGLAGISTAVDSSWTSVAVTAGYAGVALYVALTIVVIHGYWRARRNNATRGVGLGLLALTLISTVGFPIYTGNRIAGILWLLLTVLFLSDQPWSTLRDLRDNDRSVSSEPAAFA